LSRFLIEAAREGCDLNTAEGRAHIASNAKPMWMQLPDGALKRQVLGEIADLVQLANRELLDLWQPGSTTASRDRPRKGGYNPLNRHLAARAAPAQRCGLGAMRSGPIMRACCSKHGRAGHAPEEDHAMLSELPAPMEPCSAGSKASAPVRNPG
jgi:DNA primase